MKEFVICYDIADPSRLGRVHRCLRKRAMPMQYSVFLFVGSEQQLMRCLGEIAQLIDPRADDVRAYPLPMRGLKARVGRATLPAGIQWSGLPTAW